MFLVSVALLGVFGALAGSADLQAAGLVAIVLPLAVIVAIRRGGSPMPATTAADQPRDRERDARLDP